MYVCGAVEAGGRRGDLRQRQGHPAGHRHQPPQPAAVRGLQDSPLQPHQQQ